jgi:predicted outer membrane repeat protein
MGDFSRGDLRFCINHANNNPGPDTIKIPVNGTINLTEPLPDLASDMEINGPGSELLTIRRDTGGDYRLIMVAGGTVTISGVTLANGRADVGGGIYNQGTLLLDHVNVTSNESTGGQGGGIYSVGALVITESTVNSNTAFSHASASGGGIYIAAATTLTITDSTVTENRALTTCLGTCTYLAALGGGIYVAENGTLTLERSAVSLNGANAGKSVCCGSSGLGGGLFSRGTSHVSSSIFTENEASAEAGRFAVGYGGAILNAGPMTIRNSTLANNSTRGGPTGGGYDTGWARGGAIFHYTNVLFIEHSTIALNKNTLAPNQQGGGIYRGGGSVRIHNTILARNLSNHGPNLHGTLLESGYNLISNSAGGSGYGPTDIIDVDPVLGPLQDNGGPTKTIALLPGSPAIDAGDPGPVDPPEWDQRGPGFPRIVNGRIDIGAFEVQATGAPLPSQDFAVLITSDFEIIKTKGKR